MVRLLPLALLGVLLPLGGASAFPGATGKIVFSSSRDGNFEIYSMTSSGGSQTNLTANAAVDTSPAVSSEGTRVAFVRNGSITTMGIDGTAVSAALAVGDDPAWQPGQAASARIAYVVGAVINTMTPSGSDLQMIVAGTQPAWSPDGSEIAYTSTGDIYVVGVNAAGTAAIGSPTNLTQSPAIDSEPAWSPDGTKLAFISDGDIFVIDADGMGQMRLTTTSFVEAGPTWSPDGATIAFTRTVGTETDVWTMSAAGGPATQLTTATGADQQPDWAAALANSTPPVVTPSTGVKDSDQLNASTGTWAYTGPMPSYSFQWKRCNSSGGACVDIGASGSTYTVASADVDNTIRVAVTATNADGSATAVSAPTSQVAPTPPSNTSPPSISGASPPIVGAVLTGNGGSWSGTSTTSSPMRFAFEWQRCDTTGSACTPIPGATGYSYTLVSDDKGSRLKIKVTASNSVGSVSVTSGATDAVLGPGPTNTALPIITVIGPLKVGSFLSASDGSWIPAFPPVTHQWKRCDVNGDNCAVIAAATFRSYAVQAADAGFRLRVTVTAKNKDGEASATSAATDLIPVTPPANTSQPDIKGVPVAGQLLTADEGTWSGTTPFTFTYQWRRCNASGGNCAVIAGATAKQYVLTDAEIGSTVVLFVTAANSAGSATSSSDATIQVVAVDVANAVAPDNVAPPKLRGKTVSGGILRTTSGSWKGTKPIVFSFEWRRCDRDGVGCAVIDGAKTDSYKLTADDIGSTFSVDVTAENVAGTGSASSDSTKLVLPANLKKGGRVLVGTDSNDRLVGGKNGDWLLGKDGDDTLLGLGGPDQIFGGAGADKLYGGAGNDRIAGGPGRDFISSGPGADVINAADGDIDLVDCGAGKDRVVADRDDVLRSCERVTRK
jgi:hypothetical protein